MALFLKLCTSFTLFLSLCDANGFPKFVYNYFEAKKLSTDLSNRNIDPTILPSFNDTFDPVEVNIVLKIINLISVDTTHQTIKISAVYQIFWNHPQYTWNPLDYGGVYVTFRESETIWIPRLSLFNGMGDTLSINTPNGKFPILLMYNGTFYMELRRTNSFTCTFDVSKYPADSQTCSLSINSVYPDSMMYLKTTGEKHLLNAFQPSAEWNLLGVSDQIESSESIMKGMNMSVYKYTINLKRITNYYVILVVLPVSQLMILIIFIYFISPKDGDKINLAITILLSFTVFLLLLDNLLPKTNTTPFILSMITSGMLLTLFATIAAICTTHLYNKDPESLPRYFILRFNQMMSCKGHQQEIQPSPDNINSSPVNNFCRESEMSIKSVSGVRRSNYNQWEEFALHVDRIFFVIHAIMMPIVLVTYLIIIFT